MGEFVGPTNMSRQDGNDHLTQTIDTDYCRVGMFISKIRCNTADTNAHGTDKDKGIMSVPMFRCHTFMQTKRMGMQLFYQSLGYRMSCLRNLYNSNLHYIVWSLLYNSCFIAFSIMIGLNSSNWIRSADCNVIPSSVAVDSNIALLSTGTT